MLTCRRPPTPYLYQMKEDAQGNEYEVWTKILPIRDWEALEKEWSDANSSENPGDVV